MSTNYRFIRFIRPPAVTDHPYSGWYVPVSLLTENGFVLPLGASTRYGRWLNEETITPYTNDCLRAVESDIPSFAQIALVAGIKGEFNAAAKDNYDLYRSLQKRGTKKLDS